MPVMGSFKGLLARLKSPGTKQQQQHNSEAADIDVVKDQDLPLDQAETSFPTSSDPLDVARRRLHSSDPHQQALAVDALWTATCEDIVDAAQRIYAAGLVPGLAQLLSSPTQGIPACAAATLGNILSASPPACTQAAAAGAVPTLIQLLDSKPDDVLLLRYAVGALESIADNAEQSTANMQPAVGPLVDLLSCDDISTQSRAVGCLWSVMRYDEAAKEQALAAGAAERLAELLQCAVAIHDAALLHRVLMTAGILSPHPAAKRGLLEGGCIPLLVDLLTTAPGPDQQQLTAALLYNSAVAAESAVAEAVVAAQPAESLVSLLTVDHQPLRRTAVRLLELIADAVAAFRADVLAAGAVPILVQLVRSCEDEEAQQRAAGLLWTLCADGEGRAAIREAGGVQALERLRCDREDPDVIKMATGALRALQQSAVCDQAAEGCQEGDAAPEEVSVVQRVAQLSSSDAAVRSAALVDLVIRTSQDTTTSILIRGEGAVPRIVQLLQDSDPQLVLKATALLGNILVDDAEVCSAQAVAAGALQPLVDMLELHEEPLKQRYAAGALSAIAGSVVDTRQLLRQAAMQPLLVLLGSEDATTQLRACTCLGLICFQHQPTYVAVRKAGGVPLLVAMLSSSSATVVDRATAVLGNLLDEDIASRALAVGAGAVPVLVDQLSQGSQDLQRYAAGCLMCIVQTSGRGRMAALKAGAVERLTHLVDTSSCSETCNRARGALEHLKESW